MAVIMLFKRTLTLHGFLLSLELCRHFLICLFDLLFRNRDLAFFAGELHDIIHFTCCGVLPEILGLCEIDTAGSFLAVIGTVD